MRVNLASGRFAFFIRHFHRVCAGQRCRWILVSFMLMPSKTDLWSGEYELLWHKTVSTWKISAFLVFKSAKKKIGNAYRQLDCRRVCQLYSKSQQKKKRQNYAQNHSFYVPLYGTWIGLKNGDSFELSFRCFVCGVHLRIMDKIIRTHANVIASTLRRYGIEKV